VIFCADGGMNTLHPLRFKPIIKAKGGEHGGRNNRTGRGGVDLLIHVPVGTTVKDAKSGELLAELGEDGEEKIIIKGGRGGLGNAKFRTSTNRAPTRSEPGGVGVTRELLIELKLLADVGLLGFPNAGKSTLISRMSAARPKVAAYPFTTLEPSLGVVAVPGSYHSFVVADIPGLIEGAAEGAGLGHRFLRHVERCRLLLHLVSLDPYEDDANGSARERFDKINSELARYDANLAGRPQVILLSKTDLVDEERLAAVRAELEGAGHLVLAGSAVTGQGIDPLIFVLADALREARKKELD
jgi:GTP-binding protein